MSVSIISGQQLLQQIEQGSNFTLDAQGGIRTQSGVAKFFQSIGDAFRSLTEAGRTAIAQRNERLQSALTEMLRNDGVLPNLAETTLPARTAAPVSRAMATVSAHTAIQTAVANLPPEIKEKTAKVAMDIMQKTGGLQGAPAEARAKASGIVRDLTSNEAVMKALMGTTRRATLDSTAAMIDDLKNDCSQEFLRDAQQKQVDKDTSIHKSYGLDFKRGSIRSINGQTPDADYAKQLTELVRDPKIRAFVSMMAAQSGLEGSVFKILMDPQVTRANGMPASIELMPFINPNCTLHKVDLNVENDVLKLHLSYETSYNLINFGGDAFSEEDPVSLGKASYEVTAEIPLFQNMEGRILPDFAITDLTFTSLS